MRTATCEVRNGKCAIPGMTSGWPGPTSRSQIMVMLSERCSPFWHKSPPCTPTRPRSPGAHNTSTHQLTAVHVISAASITLERVAPQEHDNATSSTKRICLLSLLGVATHFEGDDEALARLFLASVEGHDIAQANCEVVLVEIVRQQALLARVRAHPLTISPRACEMPLPGQLKT
eukprot:2347279-Rhodomonas_salina.3